MNYGITIGTTEATPALLNTYVLNQTAFNVGVSTGIIHTNQVIGCAKLGLDKMRAVIASNT